MKEVLLQYAAYNSWANQRIAAVLLNLPEEQHRFVLPSSFSSVYHTLLHMWDAESGWWQRLRLQERVVLPGEHFNGSLAEMVTLYLQQNRTWEEWIGQASVAALEHVFAYRNSKKEQFKQTVWQTVMHVFNHGTYHRGQLVNMLRQLGVTRIPSTDFITWTRGKK